MKHLHRYLIALTVVLAIVKFAFYPPLSWLWVFAPVYAPIAFSVAMILLAILVALCVKDKGDDTMEMEDYIG